MPIKKSSIRDVLLREVGQHKFTHYYLCKVKPDNIASIKQTLLQSLSEHHLVYTSQPFNSECIFIIATSEDDDIVWLKMKFTHRVDPVSHDELIEKINLIF